ncbi:hypothetical protein BS78_02G149900 [Paspalum vaginatum]|nr:hypothetical protein BS78_02G149900 [Paspalum vaginatum]
MMDYTSDGVDEDLDFYFDDDDMVLNENLAPRPSEVNFLPGTMYSLCPAWVVMMKIWNCILEDGMDSLDNAAFSRMADDAERNNTLHEFWSIINKTFTSEEHTYNFYSNYARDKGFSVRKQKGRRSKTPWNAIVQAFLVF